VLQKPPATLPYLAHGDATNNAIVPIATLLGRADVPPELPRAQIPVQFPVHPPMVQIHTVHPPRVPLVVHPTTPPLMVQTFSASLSAPKPVPPRVHKVTCGNFICDYRPLKTEPFRVRLTVGGDKLPHDDDALSPAASLLESKLIINSTISDADKGARFLTADLKDHFLAAPMKNNEFMRIKYKYFPGAIRKQCNLDRFVSSDGCIHIRIKKGMHELKQAAILACKHLVNQLVPHG
jgi:hypothetical protein